MSDTWHDGLTDEDVGAVESLIESLKEMAADGRFVDVFPIMVAQEIQIRRLRARLDAMTRQPVYEPTPIPRIERY